MKIRHNPNPGWHQRRPSAVVDPDYQRQVDRSTEKAERAYRQAQKRLERAEMRLQRAKTITSSANRKRKISELEMIVELRRAELEYYRHLMERSPQPAIHRGTKSFRPVGLGE